MSVVLFDLDGGRVGDSCSTQLFLQSSSDIKGHGQKPQLPGHAPANLTSTGIYRYLQRRGILTEYTYRCLQYKQLY